MGKRLICLVLGLVMLIMGSASAELAAEKKDAEGSRQLEQVLVLSRHNIRAPLSNSGSAIGELTPHAWMNWSAPGSELTLKGAIAEMRMGQYFRKWLESEKLIPENYIPAEGEVLFYANARQRTIATARSFATGLMPIANVTIEYDGAIGDSNPVFKPVMDFTSEKYLAAVVEDLNQRYGFKDPDSEFNRRLAESFALIADVLDYRESNGFKSGEYTEWTTADTVIGLTVGKEPSVKGSLNTAYAAADALLLQYYEEDAKDAAFGKELTEEEWGRIADVYSSHIALRFMSPLVAINGAHQMLEEILAELNHAGRKITFLCGHDSNLSTVLGALDATDYELTGTLEKRAPIGGKLVFEKWRGDDGAAYGRLRMIYPGTKQLRETLPLTLEEPPMSCVIHVPGTTIDADGFCPLPELTDSIQKAIDAYDDLQREYGEEAADNAA